MNETWKPVKGYEGIYEVSDLGQVRSLPRKVHNYIKPGRIIKPHNNGHSYQYITLYKGDGGKRKTYIHRLVAEAFIPNPENYEQINHKDFDKTNNAAVNLEWVSREENMQHYRSSQYAKRVESERLSKIQYKTFERINEYKKPILTMYDKGYSISEIRDEIGIGKDFISNVLKLFDRL